jgi:hypothetical protein
MKSLRFLGTEIVLGTLIALLSVFTALASWQGSVADGQQNEFEILGMANLNDGNAEFLHTNSYIELDYNYFDNWYLNVDENPELAQYYYDNFSDSLLAAIDRDNGIWDDEYYDAMYAEANTLFDASDSSFATAGAWNARGDALQVVLMIMALGLAFAAWASLLKDESRMRLVFALLATVAFIWGLVQYIFVPTVA